MYKVIKTFRDLQDNNHRYVIGEIYPRKGVKVTTARLNELAGVGNKAKTPLIKEIEEVKTEEVKTEEITTEEVEVKVVKKTPKKKKSKKGE